MATDIQTSKEHYMIKIMRTLGGAYTPQSYTYTVVRLALNKLSLKELDALWTMVLTSGK